jgi:tetrahydromethanopterin S-methyltransferase subunit E
MNLYNAPVRNSKRNILIENIQWGLFSVNIFSWLLLLFVNLGGLQLVLMNIIPVAIIIVIERFKDNKAQEAYDKYAEWEEMKEDYLENLEEEDLYNH